MQSLEILIGKWHYTGDAYWKVDRIEHGMGSNMIAFMSSTDEAISFSDVDDLQGEAFYATIEACKVAYGDG